MTNRFSLAIITFFLCLSLASANEWQMAGNFSIENLTKIWELMDIAVDRQLPHNSVAKNLSDSLNEIWDQAWNVVVLWLPQPYVSNAILYGYAFRRHWIWINDYGNEHQSFVMWKDYNCQKWQDLSTDEVKDMPSSIKFNIDMREIDKVYKAQPALYDQDPWMLSYDFVTTFSNKRGTTYSMVLNNGLYKKISARFCHRPIDGKDEYMLGSYEKAFSYVIFATRKGV